MLTLRIVHLLCAAIWLGGMITMGVLVFALRKAGAERELLQAGARSFGRLSWIAMTGAIVTGIAQVEMMHLPWQYGKLHIKIGVVGLAVLVAGVHQLTAKKVAPAVRGIGEVLSLVLAIAIFAAAVSLGGHAG